MKPSFLPVFFGFCLLIAIVVYLAGSRQSTSCLLDAATAIQSPQLLAPQLMERFLEERNVALSDDENMRTFSRFLDGLYDEVSRYERDGKLSLASERFLNDEKLLREFRSWVAKHISSVPEKEQRQLIAKMRGVLQESLRSTAQQGEDSKQLFAIRVKRMRSLFEKESRTLEGFFCLDNAG